MLFFNSISMLPFIFWWPFIRFHFLFAAVPKFYLRQTVIHRNLYLMLIQRTFSFLRYFFFFASICKKAHGHWICKLKMLLKHLSNPGHFFDEISFSLATFLFFRFIFANKKKNISILIELMLFLVFVWNSNSLTVVCVARYLGGKKH